MGGEVRDPRRAWGWVIWRLPKVMVDWVGGVRNWFSADERQVPTQKTPIFRACPPSLLWGSLGHGLAAGGSSQLDGQLLAGTFTAASRKRGSGARKRTGGTCCPLWILGVGARSGPLRCCRRKALEGHGVAGLQPGRPGTSWWVRWAGDSEGRGDRHRGHSEGAGIMGLRGAGVRQLAEGQKEVSPCASHMWLL